MQSQEGSPKSNGFAPGRLARHGRVGMRNTANGKVERANAQNPNLSKLTSVELFAGIGGFRVAAEQRSIKTIWANDVCSRACAVYRDRFGDIREANIDSVLGGVPAHDLLTGGFPCQPFSSAGKKNGIRDPRGTLFQRIIEILQVHQPTYFILENVKRLLTMERGLHFATILASLSDLQYSVEWRLLNAMDFGLPQNRQRVFLIGIHEPKGEIRSRLATTQDLETGGTDICEAAWDVACWKPITKHRTRFPTWGMARDGGFIAADLQSFSSAAAGAPLSSILQSDVAPEFDFTEPTLRWLPENKPVNRFIQGVEILSNQGGGARMGYTIFGVNGVAPTLTSTTSRHYERYKVGDRYRRLTNIEYARAQGFPDDHCRAASVYDQYALFGNAVPPPMAGWVMDRLVHAGVGQHNVTRNQIFSLFSYAYQRKTAESSSG